MRHQLTKHATTRCQQRGIPTACIDLICHYGRPVYRGDRTRAFSLDKKRLERVHRDLGAQAAEACKGIVVLLAGETVITVFHQTEHQRLDAGTLRLHRSQARCRYRALEALAA